MAKQSSSSNSQTSGNLAKNAEIVARDQVAERLDLQPIVAGLPTDLNSLKLLSQRLNREAAEAMFDHGRVLTAIRHQSEHGEFMNHVADLGISQSWANAMMQFAHQCLEVKVASKGKLDFELINKLGASKATLFVRALLDAPEEIPTSKKDAKAKVDAYSAMSYRDMRTALAQKDKELEKRTAIIEHGKAEAKDLEKQLDSYRRSDDDAVRRACLRLQEGQIESLNEFQSTLEKHIPGGDKRTLTAEERIHLNATVEYLHQAHTAAREFLFTHFPQLSESSAADLHAAQRFVSQTAGAPPSLESKPEFLAHVLDAVEAEHTDDEDDHAKSPRPSTQRKPRAAKR